eukprot:TRINITY_DN3430_c0_g3_i1.p1 TRINITY_DN3430_c0_g3~~TRINITY_DN3430_c0_g3_i1.p1  ORF type:complete len:615 (+),score=104.00 TRINITY_DN3430_c0_g3_i1:128-1972(+)
MSKEKENSENATGIISRLQQLQEIYVKNKGVLQDSPQDKPKKVIAEDVFCVGDVKKDLKKILGIFGPSHFNALLEYAHDNWEDLRNNSVAWDLTKAKRALTALLETNKEFEKANVDVEECWKLSSKGKSPTKNDDSDQSDEGLLQRTLDLLKSKTKFCSFDDVHRDFRRRWTISAAEQSELERMLKLTLDTHPHIHTKRGKNCTIYGYSTKRKRNHRRYGDSGSDEHAFASVRSNPKRAVRRSKRFSTSPDKIYEQAKHIPKSNSKNNTSDDMLVTNNKRKRTSSTGNSTSARKKKKTARTRRQKDASSAEGEKSSQEEEDFGKWICCDRCATWVLAKNDPTIVDLSRYDDSTPNALEYLCPSCRDSPQAVEVDQYDQKRKELANQLLNAMEPKPSKKKRRTKTKSNAHGNANGTGSKLSTRRQESLRGNSQSNHLAADRTKNSSEKRKARDAKTKTGSPTQALPEQQAADDKMYIDSILASFAKAEAEMDHMRITGMQTLETNIVDAVKRDFECVMEDESESESWKKDQVNDFVEELGLYRESAVEEYRRKRDVEAKSFRNSLDKLVEERDALNVSMDDVLVQMLVNYFKRNRERFAEQKEELLKSERQILHG